MEKKYKALRGNIFSFVLLGSAILGVIAVVSLSASPFMSEMIVDIRTEPQHGVLTVGEPFAVKIIVESTIPVNAFAGEVNFNNDVLRVESIDYNTSIADLWVERPWYSNGEGIMTFAGGTTKKGAFLGEDTLITINFQTIKAGAGNISIENARILMHDGLGTDAELQEPIDAIFTVSEPADKKDDVLRKSTQGTSYVVTKNPPNTDLNNDGKQSVADVSIFMIHLAARNKRSDFNEDGKVNTADLSILLNAK